MRFVVLPLSLCAATAVAQSPVFAPPVRLEAGGKLLGKGRYFPSPVYQDLDGDGRADIVVGDLMGRLTVAYRGQDDAIAFGKEVPVLGADGKPIDLKNW
jgi:hypothetical protein